MIEGSELKVQLAIDFEFCTETKCLLLITFAPSLEHIFNCYCSQQTNNADYIRYAVAPELQPVGGLAILCFDFAKQ